MPNGSKQLLKTFIAYWPKQLQDCNPEHELNLIFGRLVGRRVELLEPLDVRGHEGLDPAEEGGLGPLLEAAVARTGLGHDRRQA